MIEMVGGFADLTSKLARLAILDMRSPAATVKAGDARP